MNIKPWKVPFLFACLYFRQEKKKKRGIRTQQGNFLNFESCQLQCLWNIFPQEKNAVKYWAACTLARDVKSLPDNISVPSDLSSIEWAITVSARSDSLSLERWVAHICTHYFILWTFQTSEILRSVLEYRQFPIWEYAYFFNLSLLFLTHKTAWLK
jgi:hypothetical protein